MCGGYGPTSPRHRAGSPDGRARGEPVAAGLVSAALAPAAPAIGAPAAPCVPHWVGSWEAAPSDAAGATTVLQNQTLRMIVTPHLGGTLRIRLSNRFGLAAVKLGPVTVAVSAGGAGWPGSVRLVKCRPR